MSKPRYVSVDACWCCMSADSRTSFCPSQLKLLTGESTIARLARDISLLPPIITPDYAPLTACDQSRIMMTPKNCIFQVYGTLAMPMVESS